jgi:hypothetical protein
MECLRHVSYGSCEKRFCEEWQIQEQFWSGAWMPQQLCAHTYQLDDEHVSRIVVLFESLVVVVIFRLESYLFGPAPGFGLGNRPQPAEPRPWLRVQSLLSDDMPILMSRPVLDERPASRKACFLQCKDEKPSPLVNECQARASIRVSVENRHRASVYSVDVKTIFKENRAIPESRK